MSLFHRTRPRAGDAAVDVPAHAPVHQSTGYYRCTSDGVILSRRHETREDAIQSRLLARQTDAVLLAEVEQHYGALLQGRNIEIGTAYGAPMSPDRFPEREALDMAVGVGFGVLLRDEVRDTFKPFTLQFHAFDEVYRFQRLRGLKQRKRRRA
jgi:hypothetical protein